MSRTTTRRRRLQDTVAIIDGGEPVHVEHITNQPIDMPTETPEEIKAGALRAIEEIEGHTASIENATQDLAHWVMLRDDMLRANSDAPDTLYKFSWGYTKARKEATTEQKEADDLRSAYQAALIVALLGEMPKQSGKGKDPDVENTREKYDVDRKVIERAFNLARQLATLGVWHQNFNKELSAFELPSGAFLCENTREENFVMRNPPETIPLLLPSAARKAGFMQSHLIAWSEGNKTFSNLVQASLARVKLLADDRISPKKPVEKETRTPGGQTNQQAPAGSAAPTGSTVVPPAGELVITPQERDAKPEDVTPEQLAHWLKMLDDHAIAICKLFAVNAVQASSIKNMTPAQRNNVTDMVLGINRLYTNADLPPIVDYNRLIDRRLAA